MSARIVSTLALAAAVCLGVAWPTETRAPRPAHAIGDCFADASLDGEEQAFLTLINNHRAANGRAPLGASLTLTRAAAYKSADMGEHNYFGHDDLDRTWSQRVRACGYGYNTYIGENIAAGVSSAQSAFNLWVNSPGHNSNMLGSNYTAIGIGRHYVPGSTYGWYWTTVFGGVNDGFTEVNEVEPIEPPAAQTKPIESTPSEDADDGHTLGSDPIVVDILAFLRLIMRFGG